MQGVGIGARSHSMKQDSKVEKGAISTRLQQVVPPIQQAQYPYQMYMAASSTVKQENTDSDFFNLTAEDESQIDPILVMRNLSNTQLCSATTSII